MVQKLAIKSKIIFETGKLPKTLLLMIYLLFFILYLV